jgi:hypothetical protein
MPRVRASRQACQDIVGFKQRAIGASATKCGRYGVLLILNLKTLSISGAETVNFGPDKGGVA